MANRPEFRQSSPEVFEERQRNIDAERQRYEDQDGVDQERIDPLANYTDHHRHSGQDGGEDHVLDDGDDGVIDRHLHGDRRRGFAVRGRAKRAMGLRLYPLLMLMAQSFPEGATYKTLLTSSGYSVGAFTGALSRARTRANAYIVVAGLQPQPLGSAKVFYVPTDLCFAAAELLAETYTLGLTDNGEICLLAIGDA